MFINPQIDIALIAIALAVVSQVMQHTLTDRKWMKSSQKEMKEKQERIKELMKKGDSAKGEIERLEKEMMDAMSKMMSGSMRLMLVSMIVFIPALWFLTGTYGNVVVPLPIPIPWLGGEGIIPIMLYNETNWLGWYLLCSLASSLGLNAVVNIAERRSAGADKK